jgi:hypothetical protein
MDMDRRCFTTGLLATGAATPMITRPDQALATTDKDGSVAANARIQLKFTTSIIVLTYFVLLLNRGTIGYNLTSPVPRFPANRANVSKLPIFGTRTRPTMQDQFGTSNIVGKLFLLNTILIMIPLTQALLAPKRTVITHREWEYEPKGAPKPLKFGTPLTPNMFAGTKPVGEARMVESELLVLIRPHLFKPESS